MNVVLWCDVSLEAIKPVTFSLRFPVFASSIFPLFPLDVAGGLDEAHLVSSPGDPVGDEEAEDGDEAEQGDPLDNRQAHIRKLDEISSSSSSCHGTNQDCQVLKAKADIAKSSEKVKDQACKVKTSTVTKRI